MRPKKTNPLLSSLFIAAALCGVAYAQTTMTWNGGDGDWTTAASWNPNTVPGTGHTAILPDVASGTRTITNSTSITVGTLQFDQATAGGVNQLELTNTTTALTTTISNGLTLGATAGTEEIKITPNAANRTLGIASTGLTLNAGGLLSLGASSNGTTSGSAQFTSNITGNVTVAGGTISIGRSTNVASANSRSISGGFTMTSGFVTFDATVTGIQSRFQIGGDASITGGTLNRNGTQSSGMQVILNGAASNYSPSSHDTSISISLSRSTNQSVTFGVPVGEVVVRHTGGTAGQSTTKTITAAPSVSPAPANTIGKLSFGNGGANGVTNMVLGSNLTGNNVPFNASMPTASFGNAGNPALFGIDTKGFTLDLTAARGTGGTTTWTPNNLLTGTPPVLSSPITWNLTNTGTAETGGIKVGNINFSSATQVNVGAGAVVEITGGSSTAINAGGGGTWDATSLLHYSGAAGATTPALLTTNRSIGKLLLSGTGSLRLESTSSPNAYANAITVQRGTLWVGANGLLGGLTAPAIKFSNGLSTTNSRIAIQFENGIDLDRNIDATAALGTGADPNSQRLRLIQSGVGSQSTVSGDITYGLVGAGTAQRLEIASVEADSVLTVSGKISPPVGQTAANSILLNGGNSGVGTIKPTNTANSYTGGTVLVNGALLISTNVPLNGAGLLGTSGTLTVADGATPNNATLSTLVDGPHTFAKGISMGANAGAATQFTNVLGMHPEATGDAIFSGNITSASDAKLKFVKLTAPAGSSVTFSGNIGANADATGVVSVEKIGAGLVTLSGTRSYDGDTTVTEGTLSLTQTGIVDNTNVRLTTGSVVNLNFEGSDTVNALFIDGVEQPAGSWGSLSSNATNKTALITGTGRLQIGLEVVADPYVAWLGGYASLTGTSRNPDADPDFDGIANAIEFLTGSDPTSSSTALAPAVTRNGSGDLVVTFKRVDAAKNYTVAVETSTNLQPPWTEILVPAAAVAGPPVTVEENGANADDITVMIPAGGDPKKFARVKCTVPFNP